jgi:asparagine synthase (glutamine-hydrolysing)
MCGIAGFVDAQQRLGRRDLELMGSALAHRGPDHQGIWHEGPLGLVHRRLSILDLSPAANQPMPSADGRYCIAYNGETYNFQELADTLQLGERRSSSDTEVVLEAFARKGPACIPMLNGMFALAIWDQAEQTLHLVRDHLGIKPLYYALVEGVLVFASEIKALTALPLLRRHLSLDQESVQAYLHLTYIPGERSIYREIRRLPPGHRAWFRDGVLHMEPFWSPDEALSQPAPADRGSATEQLHELLRDAVARQMVSDVPLGTFLSGGIDSSLVTALAASQSSCPLRTFSIGFSESRFNEAGYARRVAEHLGTDHTEYILSQTEAQARFEDILRTYDEPFGDASAIPTMLVSELARQQVTVILSGDGGDETHLGYGSYAWAERLAQPSWKALHRPAAWLFSSLPSDRYRRVAELLDYPGSSPRPSHIFSQEQYAFRLQETARLMKQPPGGHPVLPEDATGLWTARTAAERQALFDLKAYLPDDLLVKVDRASMRSSLEVRVPLLDYRLVEMALRLPRSMRVDAGGTKAMLRDILYRYVPAAYFERPKWGFGIPVGEWLRQEWRPFLTEYLSTERIEQAGLVHSQPVQQMIRRFESGHHYLNVRLWLLILLHKWYFEKHLSLTQA